MKSTIEKILHEDGKNVDIFVAENPFRGSGGGQPGDSGRIWSETMEAKVLDCLKDDSGKLFLLRLRLTRGKPAVGMPVEMSVDMERHAILSRMHSGEHLLSKIMETLNPQLHVFKVAIGEKTSSIFIHCPTNLAWDFLFRAEEQANVIVAENRPITIRKMSRNEAQQLDGLKANWGRIEEAVVTVVEIEGIDKIACCGSHASSTGEIGEIYIEDFKGGSGEWEVTFSIGNLSSMSEETHTVRRILHQMHCRPAELERMIGRLEEENKSLARALSKVRSFVVLPFQQKDVAGVPLELFALTGVPRDMGMPSLNQALDSRPDSVVLALFDDGESDKIPFVLMVGSKLKYDARFLRKIEELKISGGGTQSLLSGVTGCRSENQWLSSLAQWIHV